MTERSRFWDGTTTGDATDAPYDAGTEFARVLRALLPNGERSANKGGVVFDANGYNDYNATTPGANTARIASGLGWVQGSWHESDANVDFSIPTPSVSTRVDRIVLRKSWSAQTVRLTRIAGTEGSGAPAMTQVFGTTWDVPLWNVSITTGGTITFSNQREYVFGPRTTSNVLGSDTAASGTQAIFIPSLPAGSLWYVSFGVGYTSAGAADTSIGAIIEDANPGNGVIIAHDRLRNSWAYMTGGGIVTIGSTGVLALFIGCNGTSGTLSKHGPLFATGDITYLYGWRIG